MWELDCEESWALKNWCFWTVVLEKTLESPLDCKKIQPVHSKGDQSWVFIGRTYVEAETPIFWPPDAKSWLIWKDPELEKIEGRRRRWRQRMRWLDGITDQWTWVCVNSRSWCWTGRPGVLRFMGSQRVGHDWATELNWTRLVIALLPRSKPLLTSWLQSPSAVILEHPKNKVCHCFHCFPVYLPWSDGTRCHDLSFLNVEF